MHKGEGRVFIPAGARFKERINSSFRSTQRVPREGLGKWYDRDVRRLIFLAGKSVGSKESPFRVDGESWMIVRGYNAIVHYRIAEEGDSFSTHHFPIRNPEKEARERQREKRRKRLLNSKNPYIRKRERFKARGGLYRMGHRSENGVFTGY